MGANSENDIRRETDVKAISPQRNEPAAVVGLTARADFAEIEGSDGNLH
jgi:hypothetical protein